MRDWFSHQMSTYDDPAPRKRTWLSDLDFVRIWEFSDSIEEMAEATNLRIESVSTRARNMRKHGVPLKILPKLRSPVQRKYPVKDEAYWNNIAKKRLEMLSEAKEKGLSGKQLRLLSMENRSDP